MKPHFPALMCVISLSLFNCLVATVVVQAQSLKPLPPPKSRDEKMAWFREAKFGLFIHWGLYAIPAGEWKGKRSPGIGEWVMHRMQIPVKEYEQLALQFNPSRFDAEDWVKLAEDAGMRYIVITSKHHDGFALYHSSVSRYNIVDATPFRRDVLKELADACARRGIRRIQRHAERPQWPAGIPGAARLALHDEAGKSLLHDIQNSA